MQCNLLPNIVTQYKNTSLVNQRASMCLNCDDFVKLHSLRLHLCFFNSPCFQYILRKKRLTFWEISIGVNFISLTSNDAKPDFWPWKWEVDLYTSLTVIPFVCSTWLEAFLSLLYRLLRAIITELVIHKQAGATPMSSSIFILFQNQRNLNNTWVNIKNKVALSCCFENTAFVPAL